MYATTQARHTSNGYVLSDAPERLGRLDPVPEAIRHDRDALWDRLRRDGYLFLRGLLDPEVVAEFRRYYFTSMAGVGLVEPGSDPSEGRDAGTPVLRAPFREILFGQIVPGEHYAALCGQPALRGWFEWFYGEPTFLHRRKIIRHNRPAETGIGNATQAHYDLVYLREGTDKVLSCWIPLGDCPLERGGLTYLEGSHRVYARAEAEGRLRHPAASITADLPALADQHDARWLIADYEAGDVVVHSPYIVHASLDNADPRRILRLSTDIRYQRAGDPIDWRWQDHWSDDDALSPPRPT